LARARGRSGRRGPAGGERRPHSYGIGLLLGRGAGETQTARRVADGQGPLVSGSGLRGNDAQIRPPCCFFFEFYSAVVSEFAAWS
jgi:hypothetical protein